MEPAEYRRLAAVEDTMGYFRALHGHVHVALDRHLGGRPARILDAGCGTGGLIRRLTEFEPRWSWVGVDQSTLACELARGRCEAEIREASVTALPFAPAEFDAVVSADVLYHVEDDATALREFARVLRPGGVAVLNVPAHRWLWSYHDVATHAERRYARSELRAKLVAADLDVVRLTHWNALLLPLVWARRKVLPPPAGGSDVQAYSLPVELLFEAAMALERGWLGLEGNFVFGSSLLAVAKKRS